MKLMLRLLREPLLQFFALGGVIYLVFMAVSDARKAPTDRIVVTPQPSQLVALMRREPITALAVVTVGPRPPVADNRVASLPS